MEIKFWSYPQNKISFTIYPKISFNNITLILISKTFSKWRENETKEKFMIVMCNSCGILECYSCSVKKTQLL